MEETRRRRLSALFAALTVVVVWIALLATLIPLSRRLEKPFTSVAEEEVLEPSIAEVEPLDRDFPFEYSLPARDRIPAEFYEKVGFLAILVSSYSCDRSVRQKPSTGAAAFSCTMVQKQRPRL